MLHLLPIRKLLFAIFALAGLAVLAAVYAGAIGTGDALEDAKHVIRWSSFAALVLMIVPCAAWRWVPAMQRVTFPYLGGYWAGELHFSGQKGSGTRAITLNVAHTPLRIKLILDSEESTSRTLVVHAERDAELNRDRLYYVYLNERKEGMSGAGDNYRGLAVLRVEFLDQIVMCGDYFTERQGSGKLRLERRRSHVWWELWK